MINIRFIFFVFVRFLWMFFITAISAIMVSYLIQNPNTNRLEQAILLGLISSLMPTVFIFPFSFSIYPYYDCNKGKHNLKLDLNPDDAWWYCTKCNHKRELTTEEYKVLTVKQYVRMYPNK